jgi:hypothetical protein
VNIGPNNEPSYSVCSCGRIILYSLAATDWFDKRPKFLLIFRKPPAASQRPIEEILIHSVWMAAETGKFIYNQLFAAGIDHRRAGRRRISLN